MIKPTAVVLTPKVLAKSGIAGMIIPKPTATKKPTTERIKTSLGSWRIEIFIEAKELT